jgi:hypothetical protein
MLNVPTVEILQPELRRLPKLLSIYLFGPAGYTHFGPWCIVDETYGFDEDVHISDKVVKPVNEEANAD